MDPDSPKAAKVADPLPESKGSRAPESYGSKDLDEHVMFSCNICYELASDPVVTLCGHLYCWPCLFRWMHVQAHARTCPVCKAGLDLTRVVPIYGHGERLPKSEIDMARKQPEGAVVAPSRPLGQRETPGARDGRGARDGEGSRSGATAPFNALPSFFNLSSSGGGGGFVEPLSSEQQHQAFLSRLLLMLGSFVIMCLLLF